MAVSGERGDKERNPVLIGIVALVAVTVSVALILGGAALAATRVFGGGEESSGGDTSGGGQSMYLPRPEQTQPASGPLTTLGSGDDGSSEVEESPSAEETEEDDEPISISASTNQVGVMETFEINGTYPRGEGAILQVQRFEGNVWSEFQAQDSVNGGAFSLPIQTGVLGENRFRVIDTGNRQAVSNEVTVTVG